MTANEYKERIKDLENTIENLRTALSNSNSAGVFAAVIADLHKDIQRLTNQIIVNNQEMTTIREIITSSNNDNKELSKQIKSILKENKELHKTIEGLNKMVEQLTNTIIEKDAIIEKQSNQLNRNSRNSSKPSSTDGFKTLHSTRKKSDKPSGGQIGHKGHINKIEIDSLANEPIVLTMPKYPIKQIIDIKTIVERKNYYIMPSGLLTEVGPIYCDDALTGVLEYGENLKALVIELREYMQTPMNKVKKFISSLSDGVINLSEGTIQNWSTLLADRTKNLVTNLIDLAKQSDILCVDESPVKLNGKQQYIHCYCSNEITVLDVQKSRGKDGTIDIDILPGYDGIIISDHFGLYLKRKNRGECNVHILRYLQGVIENYDRKWAKDMTILLEEIHDEKERLKANGIEEFPQLYINECSKRYDEIIQLAHQEYIDDTRKHKSPNDEDCKLYRRMEEFKEQHLLFMINFAVPFSNNLAEQSFRNIKTKQHACGSFRSELALKSHIANRTVIQTAIKQKLNVHDTIVTILRNEIKTLKDLIDACK